MGFVKYFSLTSLSCAHSAAAVVVLPQRRYLLRKLLNWLWCNWFVWLGDKKLTWIIWHNIDSFIRTLFTYYWWSAVGDEIDASLMLDGLFPSCDRFKTHLYVQFKHVRLTRGRQIGEIEQSIEQWTREVTMSSQQRKLSCKVCGPHLLYVWRQLTYIWLIFRMPTSCSLVVWWLPFRLRNGDFTSASLCEYSCWSDLSQFGTTFSLAYRYVITSWYIPEVIPLSYAKSAAVCRLITDSV